MKSKKQPALACPIDAIGVSDCPMVALSGFYESHECPPLGDASGIVLSHRYGHWNDQQRGGAFCSSLCWLSPWRPPGQYGASSSPMAEFSGFYESPGPPSSGNVLCISPAHRNGHRNGLRRRCICFPPPPISIAGIVAKDHVMDHIN